jgi:hypothetical protein
MQCKWARGTAILGVGGFVARRLMRGRQRHNHGRLLVAQHVPGHLGHLHTEMPLNLLIGVLPDVVPWHIPGQLGGPEKR